MLNRGIIIEALTLLGQKAKAENIELEITVYGGSAMILAYASREISKDVDVIIHPAKKGLQLAKEVAKEMGIHLNWLNDDVKAYVGEKENLVDSRRKLDELNTISGLRVWLPTAKYLLAMKELACREPVPGQNVDEKDLEHLIRKMEIKSIEQVKEAIEKFYEDRGLPIEQVERITKIIERVDDERQESSHSQTRDARRGVEDSDQSSGVRV